MTEDNPESPSLPKPEDQEQELEDIVARHEAALLRYATRLVNDVTAAQDVVQKTFIKLCHSWKTGTHPTAQLSAWLYRVTHNAAVDYIRSESRRSTLLKKHASDREARTARGPNQNEISEAADLAAQMLKLLSLRERQLVILKVYEEKSYREISAITGLTESNVGYILHHSMKKLAEMLKADIAARKSES